MPFLRIFNKKYCSRNEWEKLEMSGKLFAIMYYRFGLLFSSGFKSIGFSP